MGKKLICLMIGHKVDFRTAYEFDPDNWEHTFTQIKFCLRCGRILKRVVTKL